MEKVKIEHIVGKPNHIQTASGIKFYPFKPNSELICIEDIAHALSQQCRFSGHTSWGGKMKHYSVAQHSLYCSYICKYPLWALLHDATEVYSVDVPTPIKRRIPEFKEMEDKIEKAISKKFNLKWPRPKEVKDADIIAFNIEWALLMECNPDSEEYKTYIKDDKFVEILNMSMEEVRDAFIKRFDELSKKV